MKRLIVLLLALGIVVAADRRTWADDEKPKEKEEKKKDDKKEDKKDDKKDKKDKEEKKVEVKLTDDQKKDLAKLSGTFVVTTSETDGKKKPDDELKKLKVVQKMAEWSFALGEDTTTGKDMVMPKAIDSTYTNGPSKGKTAKGIYKYEGDTVTYCWAEPGKDRPTDFTTKADSGLTLMVLKRTEDKKPEDKPKDKEKEDKDKKEKKAKEDKAKEDKDKKEKEDKDKKKDKDDE